MSKIIPCVTLLKPGELRRGDICHIYRQTSISVTAEQRPLAAGTLPEVLREGADKAQAQAPLLTRSCPKRDWTRAGGKGSTYCLFPTCLSEIPVSSQAGFKAALPVALRTISATYNMSINLINANAMSHQISNVLGWGGERKNCSRH